jgi:hypothetical protein
MGEQTVRFQKKILVALHGVEPSGPDEHNDLPQDLTRFLINQKEPVSRFLKLALIELYGRKLYTGDKIEWKANIGFRGSVHPRLEARLIDAVGCCERYGVVGFP